MPKTDSTKRVAIAGLILVTLVISCYGQRVRKGSPKPRETTSPSKVSLPGVKDVLAHYLRASGGEAKVRKLRTRVSKGVVFTELVDIPYCTPVEIYARSPNTQVVKQVAECSIPIVQIGFDGTKGWVDYPLIEPTVLEESESQDPEERKWLGFAKFRALFYPSAEIQKIYPEIVFAGKGLIENRVMYILEVDRPSGFMRWYFDIETGLLTCTTFQPSKGDSESKTAETCYWDYRSVDGVMIPFTIRSLGLDVWRTFNISQVTHNTVISDSKFRPRAIADEPSLPPMERMVKPNE